MPVPRLGARARMPSGPAAPLVVGFLVMCAGIWLRLRVLEYSGPNSQVAFNTDLFKHALGSYTDIASLYLRDGLWHHRIPYVDYRFEYPVLIGVFTWVFGYAPGGLAGYFLASAAVLIAAGVFTIALLRRIPGARPWLLALSPTLIFYVLLNWDMLAIALTVAAVLLLLNRRDYWGTALLALATWTKLFPVLLFPFVIVVLLFERRVRAAIVSCGIFALVTLAVNLPFAYGHGPHGWVVRRKWTFFFTFNRRRHGGLTIWDHIAPKIPTHILNRVDTLLVLTLMAVLVIAVAVRFRSHRSRYVLVPALGASISGALFLDKIYSPQYTLWLAVILALLGAPVLLAAALGILDAVYYYVSFRVFQIPKASLHDFIAHVLHPAADCRELMVFIIFGWSFSRIFRSPPAPFERASPAVATVALGSLRERVERFGGAIRARRRAHSPR